MTCKSQGHDLAGRRRKQGGDRWEEARLVVASLKRPEGPGIRFRGGGVGLEVKRLLSSGSDGLNPVDKVLAQGEKTLI